MSSLKRIERLPECSSWAPAERLKELYELMGVIFLVDGVTIVTRLNYDKAKRAQAGKGGESVQRSHQKELRTEPFKTDEAGARRRALNSLAALAKAAEQPEERMRRLADFIAACERWGLNQAREAKKRKLRLEGDTAGT